MITKVGDIVKSKKFGWVGIVIAPDPDEKLHEVVWLNYGDEGELGTIQDDDISSCWRTKFDVSEWEKRGLMNETLRLERVKDFVLGEMIYGQNG